MDENIEVKRVDVFDLDYKGCRGCLGCQMKRTVEVGCVVKDGAHDLLKEIRTADGLVFATPIYFMEISAQLRALFELLFLSGLWRTPNERSVRKRHLHNESAAGGHGEAISTSY